ERMVEARPRYRGPDVIQLPVERAHGVRLQAAPETDGGLDGEGLLQLAEVEEVSEAVRHAEVARHRLDYALVAGLVTLVELHDGCGGVPFRLVRELADDVHGRE